MIVYIFFIVIVTTCILQLLLKKRVSKWVNNYNLNSIYYKLQVDPQKCSVSIKELYAKIKTIQGATSGYCYKNSILFFEKNTKKYFSIESYSYKDSISLFKKKYQVNDIYSKDLSGKTISAWINIEDMKNEIFGSKINPIRVFKLLYDSKEYLTEEYLSNVKSYMISYRSDRTVQSLYFINLLLVIVCVALFFQVVRYLYYK